MFAADSGFLLGVIGSEEGFPASRKDCSVIVMGSLQHHGLLQWLSSKASACNAGDPGSIPGSGRSPGGGNDNPLQCSCLENPMDRGAWWATVHGVTKSQMYMTEWLSTYPVPQVSVN